MAKNYRFVFFGSKEEFQHGLDRFPTSDCKFYYFDEYIVETTDTGYRFGVERGGHSGGYWFIPEISEQDGRTVFFGRIRYIDAYTYEKGFKKFLNVVETVFLYIFLLPFLLPFAIIFKGFMLLKGLVRRMKGLPMKKDVTTEDRLFDLMVYHLHCVQI